jgi:hypothetical protein
MAAATSAVTVAAAMAISSRDTPVTAITVTTEDADAINVVAADASKTVRGDRGPAVAIREAAVVAIASRAAVNAHRWRQSYRMEKRQAGSIRSATVVSFDAPRTATSPNPAMHMSQCR